MHGGRWAGRQEERDRRKKKGRRRNGNEFSLWVHCCVLLKLPWNPQEPWRARITEDADGLYKESLEVEAVAQGRSAVSLSDLPGVELFERRWRLIDEDKDLTVVET